MKLAVLLACLLGMAVAGCGSAPSAGPEAEDVVGQAKHDSDILFDVVKIDEHVLDTILAQPKDSFAVRFGGATQPPELRIAVGDSITVVIWEAAAGGLFTEPAPELLSPAGRGIEPLMDQIAPPREEVPGARTPEGRFGAPPPGAAPTPPATPGQPAPQGGQDLAQLQQGLQSAAAETARKGIEIPQQPVGVDGGITVPYAGRIPAAGRTPDEVRQTIEERLAGKGIEPQALVLVTKSPANAVTVAGEVAKGGRIPLSPDGNRLLQVISAAGGAGAPAHEVFVRLSRGGVTATIPLDTLVSQPAEDIYAQPGDVLTLVRMPRTFSVFGATAVNAAITFDAPELNLSEGLAMAGGLRDDRADPAGVFLFRYEPVAVVAALDQPIATRTVNGASPVVYRFDMWDGKSYLLAQRFPLHDKDIIFVADAAGRRIYKFVATLAEIAGPVESGLLACFSIKC